MYVIQVLNYLAQSGQKLSLLGQPIHNLVGRSQVLNYQMIGSAVGAGQTHTYLLRLMLRIMLVIFHKVNKEALLINMLVLS